MKRSLLLAAAAAAMIAAPAYAQMRTDTDAGKAWTTPHRSTASGLPDESPQVDSLPRGNTTYSGTSSTYSRTTGGTVMDNTTSPQGGRVETQSGAPTDRGAMTRSRTQTYGSGSTGNTGMATGSGAVVSRQDIQSRRGRGQNELELTQTTLLNEFSAQGYTAVRDFRKNGENYVANVQDQQGRWMTVELDPRTGSITPVR